MKIIKRNGAEAVFDISKIESAVTRANAAVAEQYRMTQTQISRIAESVALSCQELGRSPAVEEIQDLVEKAIMAHGAFEVAKQYITYRYTRSLIRKSNTTDDRILSLIESNNEEVKQENANKNPTVNAVQRDYMAGEVSKDITRRLLLPKEIVEAHEAGIIHFHDSDYYAQHMHNCDLVNLEDMLQNGTVISGTMIEKPPFLLHGLQHCHPDHCPGGLQPVRRAVHQPDASGALCPGEPGEDPGLCPAGAPGVCGCAGSGDGLPGGGGAAAGGIRRGVQTIQYQVVTLMTTNGHGPVYHRVYVSE